MNIITNYFSNLEDFYILVEQHHHEYSFKLNGPVEYYQSILPEIKSLLQNVKIIWMDLDLYQNSFYYTVELTTEQDLRKVNSLIPKYNLPEVIKSHKENDSGDPWYKTSKGTYILFFNRKLTTEEEQNFTCKPYPPNEIST